jgi:hypothetical protein
MIAQDEVGLMGSWQDFDTRQLFHSHPFVVVVVVSPDENDFKEEDAKWKWIRFLRRTKLETAASQSQTRQVLLFGI